MTKHRVLVEMDEREAHQLVASVVGSAVLDGRVIDESWRRVLFQVAVGAVDGDVVVRAEVERACRDLRDGR